MRESVKGTVTSLSSIFAPEDAQKASVRVPIAISERQNQVHQLQSFLNDNNSLVNLVKKLPDQLHHDIMVPFGKAAFFPGRLIHTNEFNVLLGEGYYAERTSKQTVEILKRRGKDLESQIVTINATIKDLKFEADFFDQTAVESAEGIVEIREDYVDEVSNKDEVTTAGEDEFARILSRIDELEKEEVESEIDEQGEEEEDTSDLSQLMYHTSLEPEIKNSKVQTKIEHSINKKSLQNHTQQDVFKPFKPKNSPSIPVSKDSHVKNPINSGSNIPQRLVEINKSKESFPVSTNEISDFGLSSDYDQSKAFTGSIVEHTHDTEKSQKGQTSMPTSKPYQDSRCKESSHTIFYFFIHF